MAEQHNEQGGVENQEAHPETTAPSENNIEVSVSAAAPAASEAEPTPEETSVRAAAPAPTDAAESEAPEAAEERGVVAKLTDAAGTLVHQVQEVVGEAVEAAKEKVADLLPHAEASTEEGGTEGAEDEAAKEKVAELLPHAEASTEEGGTEGAEDEAAKGKRKRERGKKGGSGRKGRKLETFTVNEEIQGTVRSVQPYGAFVDVGAERDGLIHISELRDGFVEKVGDVVKEGDQVTVRVKEVDSEKGRLSLTMRSAQAMEKERQQQEDRESRLRLRDLKEGQELTGKVTSIVDFGAFVDIGATTDGLVHISELSEERVNRVTDVVQEGLEVTVRVLSVDKKRNRISLTMRQHVPEEEYTYEEEEEGTLPSAMELAFARARERSKKEKRGKKGSKRQDEQGKDVIDDIIARTLGQHEG